MQIFIMHFRNEDYFQVVNLASMTTKILKVSLNWLLLYFTLSSTSSSATHAAVLRAEQGSAWYGNHSFPSSAHPREQLRNHSSNLGLASRDTPASLLFHLHHSLWHGIKYMPAGLQSWATHSQPWPQPLGTVASVGQEERRPRCSSEGQCCPSTAKPAPPPTEWWRSLSRKSAMPMKWWVSTRTFGSISQVTSARDLDC